MAGDVELTEIREFLSAHAPFETLPASVLGTLPGRLSMRYFRRGSAVIERGLDNHHLYVVRSGAVDIHDEHGELVERAGVGECLGSITLVLGNPSTYQVTAIEDTLTIVMDATTFHELGRTDHAFARFFDEQRARRMQGAVDELRLGDSASVMLHTPVRDLLRRAPVTVPVDVTVREAATTMTEHAVSSLLVVDGERLVGILTDRDLRTRVVAAGADPQQPVTAFMTHHPATAAATVEVHEVLLEMTARNIHHLPILDAGQPVGVVTATDLMRLERSSPIFLVGEIAKQTTVSGVVAAAERLPRMVQTLVSQQVSTELVGRAATTVGDTVERRLLALAEERLGPPPAPYCWVSLGSRARHEQALGGDQDHAMVLDDSVREGDLPYFAELAESVADGLENSGYPRCRGEVMATNPRWRLTLAGWQRQMLGWLGQPVPEAILDASIFFDMRPVYGETRLAGALLSAVARAAPDSTGFLVHLAKEAARHEPPIGFFRGFVVDTSGEHAHTLDIKAGGTGALVEIARVFALASGSREVGTRARLRAAVSAGVLGSDLGDDLGDAFEVLSYVRLRHQAEQVGMGEPPDNHVDPDDLPAPDRRHLREAFRAVRAGQAALAARYPLHFVS